MNSELKASARHRKSLLPRLNDAALVSCSSPELRSLRISGACRVTDKGLSDLIRCHLSLQVLDVSYCGLVTNESMVVISEFATQLESLNVSGCSRINDTGMIAIFSRCAKLQKVELVACPITDKSIQALFQLNHLQSLNIRNCDNVTDASFTKLNRALPTLTQITIASLDMVTIASIRQLVKCCEGLRSLTADSCCVTSKEYSDAVRYLPFAQPIGGCRLQPRSRSIQEYNHFVLRKRLCQEKLKVLARFGRWVARFRVHQLHRIHRQQAVRRIGRFIEKYIRLNRWRNVVRVRKVQMERACRLQSCMRKLMAIHLARRKALHLRITRDAATNIQRTYRGHRCRKWYRRTLFDRLYFFYGKIGHLAHKIVVITAARKLHKDIVRVQSVCRMYIQYIRYLIFRRGLIRLQRRVRCKLMIKRNKTILISIAHQEVQMIMLTHYRREKAAYIIAHNWVACRYNFTFRKSTMKVATVFSERIGFLWAQAILIQKFWLRKVLRCRAYYSKLLQAAQQTSATRIQAAWRMHLAYFEFLVLREMAMERRWRWERLVIQRPRLIAGSWARVIQRRIVLRLNHLKRIKACAVIQRRYRAYRTRPLTTVVTRALLHIHALKIQRMFYGYRFRRNLELRIARKHMAAWKLTVRLFICPVPPPLFSNDDLQRE